MIYGYARCSTNEELQDINRQKRELREMGATDETIYFEYESGVKEDKAELGKLLNVVQQGDAIVTTEVSRLTRSTKQLCDIIQKIKAKGLKLIVKGSITIDCTNGDIDPMTNAFLQITGVFAELERNIISQRVKSGMANAKANGAAIGRPEVGIDNLPKKFIKNYRYYALKHITKNELAERCKVSRQSIYKYIKIYEEVHGKSLTKAEKRKKEKLWKYIKCMPDDVLENKAKEEMDFYDIEEWMGKWDLKGHTRREIPAIYEYLERDSERAKNFLDNFANEAGLKEKPEIDERERCDRMDLSEETIEVLSIGSVTPNLDLSEFYD